MITDPMNDPDNFWGKADRSGGPDSCWRWTAAHNHNGYGLVSAGRTRLAHRVSWQLTHGSIPPGGGYHGTCVLHRCDVRDCVNPAHLFLGTNADNIRDRDLKGRQRSPRGDEHWSRVHPDRRVRGDKHYSRSRPERLARGARNGSAKLCEEQVVAILSDKRPQKVVAADHGVSQSLISLIHRGMKWAHVARHL